MKTFIKLTFLLTFLQAVLLTSLAQTRATEATRKVLFSIGKNERPVLNGSSVALSPIGSSVIVLTSDDEGRIFVYENGEKRGPFKDIAGTSVAIPDDNPEEYDPVYIRESDADYEKYLVYNDAGEVTLNFGGKKYGPYQFVLEFYTTNDKTSFYAIVMKNGKPQIITSAGTRIDLEGQPGYNYLSSTGKKLMVTTIKEKNEAGELLNRDLSGMSTEEIARLRKEIEGKQTGPPEAYIWFQDGKKYGPYNPKKIAAGNPSFNKTGGDNWLLTMDSRLYINGIVVKDLRNEQITPSNVWLTNDGKRYVIIVYNRIEFSDGTVVRDPLKLRISVKDNKITIWWLLFENEKDICLYSKTIQ